MGNCTAVIKKKSNQLSGSGRSIVADVSLSGAYSAGGDTIPFSVLGVKRVSTVVMGSGATTPGGHAVEVVYGADEYTALKLKVRDAATGTEVSGDQSAQKIRLTFFVMLYR